MKMNFRERLFTFSGLVLCLFQISLSQELAPPVRTLNVVPLCENYNSTVSLGHSSAILKAAGEHGPLDCEILLGKSLDKSIVISFYEYDLKEDDELVFKDSEGTELSLTGIGQHLSGKKSFIFKSPVAIHFTTNGSSSYTVKDKFKFVFTLTHDSLCKKDEFKCTNLQCISKYLVCNQLNNCGDGSDEIDCNPLCTANEFKCDNKKCIPTYKVCNLRDDCGDMSDENICNQDCEIRQQFKCSNSRCISNLQVCDDKNDCGDWSDETNCYRACDYNKFRCNNKKCIDSWKVCDTRDDCGDRSDENNCRSCYSYEFRCSNRKCISNSLVCNNRDDCGDFSDEKGCSSTNKLREDEILEREVTTLKLPIILSSVAIGIVLIVLITLSICFCVTKAKSSKQPKNTAASAAQQSAPSSLMGRMRQSFRSHGQPSAPPLEMVTGSENVPHEFQRPHSVMGRIRQSFRSRQQQTVQPPDTNTASDMRSENPGRPAIYPNLPAGVDNPEFKVEE